jgi:hypothetical protein
MSEDMMHLKCTRTGRMYRVIGHDPVALTITIKGPNGTFTEPFVSGARFTELGYERILGPVEGAIELENTDA